MLTRLTGDAVEVKLVRHGRSRRVGQPDKRARLMEGDKVPASNGGRYRERTEDDGFEYYNTAGVFRVARCERDRSRQGAGTVISSCALGRVKRRAAGGRMPMNEVREQSPTLPL